MRHSSNYNPILVTGTHRSGSTFIGRMLSLPLNIGYISEPFNPEHGLKGIPNSFLYIKEGMINEEKYFLLIKNLLEKNGIYRYSPIKNNGSSIIKKIAVILFKNRANLYYLKAKYNPFVNRYLIKDPIACLASEWLHQKFKMSVVIIVRHPAGFTSSIKKWNMRYNFEEFLSQKELMIDYFNNCFNGYNVKNLSIIEEGALLWKSIYSILLKYKSRNPNMIIVRYEDIASNPLDEFSKLYSKLGIDFTYDIEKQIIKYTRDINPNETKYRHAIKKDSRKVAKQWVHVLTKKEIEYIKKSTSDIADIYYSKEEWK